jgi:hypothetical protein
MAAVRAEVRPRTTPASSVMPVLAQARRPICIYYARGYCRRGPACPYLHSGPVARRAQTAPRARTVLQHDGSASPGSAGGAAERAGDAERVVGGTGTGDAVEVVSACENTTKVDAGIRWEGDGMAAAMMAAAAPETSAMQTAVTATSDEVGDAGTLKAAPPAPHECGICFENPLLKRERYGILVGCDHPFCLACIKAWRGAQHGPDANTSSRHRKTCPLCRKRSDFVVPSFSFGVGEEKLDIVENYRAACADIPCKYFRDNGSKYGSCPFGSICFYKHERADGTLECKDPEQGPPAMAHRRRAQRNRRAMQRPMSGHNEHAIPARAFMEAWVNASEMHQLLLLRHAFGVLEPLAGAV